MTTVMKLIGVALLWVGLSALVYLATAESGLRATAVAGGGFFSFASGVMILAEGLKRDVVAHMTR